MKERARHAVGLLLAATAFGACASPRPYDACRERIERGASLLEEGELAAADEVLEEVLVTTQEDPARFALQRFYAAYLQARAHVVAGMAEPYLGERTRAASRIGPIGRREAGTDTDRRPSADRHLVAAVYHASRARGLYERAARSGPERDGVALLPDELWSFGVDDADASLQILLTAVYGRLGFREEVGKTLDRSPELLQLASCLAAFERYDVQPVLRPWICAAVFDHLEGEREEVAYRFGVLAVEGKERFGHALPPRVVERIEDWIVDGATVRFVDPESQTPYIRGERRSPISGTPHLEYVPVEKR